MQKYFKIVTLHKMSQVLYNFIAQLLALTTREYRMMSGKKNEDECE